MAIAIHFFRDNELPKLDFASFFSFFDAYENFKVFYIENNEMEIEYRDPDFQFSYRYLVTKNNRVANIYRLNPKYTNVNIMLELPLLISSYLAKEILSLAEKICQKFNLVIYTGSFPDVKPFSMADMMVLFTESRAAMIAESGMSGKLYMASAALDAASRYQRLVVKLVSLLKARYPEDEIQVPVVTLLADAGSGTYGLATSYELGTSSLIPLEPSFAFVRVIDEGSSYIVSAHDFMATMGRSLVPVENVIPGVYDLHGRNVRLARKLALKLRKHEIIDKAFSELPLSTLIDAKEKPLPVAGTAEDVA